MDEVDVKNFAKLGQQQQQQVLQLPVMAHLHRQVWDDGWMFLSGAKALISQVGSCHHPLYFCSSIGTAWSPLHIHKAHPHIA